MNEQQDKPGTLRRWLWRVALGLAVTVMVGIVAVAVVFVVYSADLPSVESLVDYRPLQTTRLLDRRGRVVAELFEQRRTVVALEQLPLHLRQAFLAAEDADFYKHPGLDFWSMLRALWRNIRAGRVVEGGSTISQQVVKTFLLDPERSLRRKIKEALLTLRIESNLSKDEILNLYLNQIAFGHGRYGVEEAARFYFGRSAREVDLAQAATLAALPKSPALYSPLQHPERARRRRDWILEQMADKGFVGSAVAAAARRQPLQVLGQGVTAQRVTGWYTEYCRRLLVALLGRETVYGGGLVVRLALDLDLQRLAQQAVSEGLRRLEKRRYGFRGALDRLSEEQIARLRDSLPRGWAWRKDLVWTVLPPGPERQQPRALWVRLSAPRYLQVPVKSVTGPAGRRPGVIVDLGTRDGFIAARDAAWIGGRMAKQERWWQVLRAGDLVEVYVKAADGDEPTLELTQPPRLQAALVAIDAHTRHVLALVGGDDFATSSFIRATQSRRQPGSAFKPIVYAAALARRLYTPASILVDSPEVYRAARQGRDWKPANFERVFHGEVTLRYALAHSINTVAVKIAGEVGPRAVVEMARRLGITSPLEPTLSLALGSYEVTPLELTNAYAAFIAGGRHAQPVFMVSANDSRGAQVALPPAEAERQALEPEVAYLMVSLLRSVIDEGTGKKAQALGRALAGKTGTTNGQRDGWFVGFSPDLVVGVWVGRDDHRSMGGHWAQGAGSALPIWIQFMAGALDDYPPRDFVAPEQVSFARIDMRNGLLARPDQLYCRREVFLAGTEPREVSAREGDCRGAPRQDSSNGGRLPKGMFR